MRDQKKEAQEYLGGHEPHGGRDDLGSSPQSQLSHVAHTPLPWHVGPHYKSDIESREGRVTECRPLMTPRAVANAAFIVRACNSHDVLLDALKLIECVYRRNVVQPGEPSSVLDAVQAAIAKAEGR